MIIHEDSEGKYIINPFDEDSASDVYEVPVNYGESLDHLWEGVFRQRDATFMQFQGDALDAVHSFRDKSLGKRTLSLAMIQSPEGLSYKTIAETLESAQLVRPDLRTGLSLIASRPDLFGPTRVWEYDREIVISDHLGDEYPEYKRKAMIWEPYRSRFGQQMLPMYSTAKWPMRHFVVCDADLKDYEQPFVRRAIPSTEQAQLLINKAIAGAQDSNDKERLALYLDTVKGLALHPDSHIAHQAINFNARAIHTTDVETPYYEIGSAFGHPDVEVAQYAVGTLLQTELRFATDSDYYSPHKSFALSKALFWHAQDINESTAPQIFNKAIELINSKSERQFSGDLGRRNIQGGYELLAYLARSKDENASRDAVYYLVTCMYGDPTKEPEPDWLIHWHEERILLSSDSSEKEMWTVFKKFLESKRFSHQTEEACQALRYKTAAIPHPHLKELADYAVRDYDEAKSKSGLYIEFQ